jgi:subtilisin-like proprotein convertase family protein
MVCLLAALACQRAVGEVYSFTDNAPVPDGSGAGVSDTESISSGISQIGLVQVTLDIAGNFNGDLYVYLQHGSSLSVLMNRVGRTAANPFGYADSGLNVTFLDSAANGNIHTYQNVVVPPDGSPLTGTWQPDGRTTSPSSVLDTDPSTAGLSLFNGQNASGNWTLFVADLSPGGTSELMGWQLSVEPVPEPGTATLGLCGLGLFFLRFRGRS